MNDKDINSGRLYDSAKDIDKKKDKEDKILAELLVPDESMTDKSKKDFEYIPSEYERLNHKLNKRMNKLQHGKGIPDNLIHPTRKPDEERDYDKELLGISKNSDNKVSEVKKDINYKPKF